MAHVASFFLCQQFMVRIIIRSMHFAQLSTCTSQGTLHKCNLYSIRNINRVWSQNIMSTVCRVGRWIVVSGVSRWNEIAIKKADKIKRKKHSDQYEDFHRTFGHKTVSYITYTVRSRCMAIALPYPPTTRPRPTSIHPRSLLVQVTLLTQSP